MPALNRLVAGGLRADAAVRAARHGHSAIQRAGRRPGPGHLEARTAVGLHRSCPRSGGPCTVTPVLDRLQQQAEANSPTSGAKRRPPARGPRRRDQQWSSAFAHRGGQQASSSRCAAARSCPAGATAAPPRASAPAIRWASPPAELTCGARSAGVSVAGQRTGQCRRPPLLRACRRRRPWRRRIFTARGRGHGAAGERRPYPRPQLGS